MVSTGSILARATMWAGVAVFSGSPWLVETTESTSSAGTAAVPVGLVEATGRRPTYASPFLDGWHGLSLTCASLWFDSKKKKDRRRSGEGFVTYPEPRAEVSGSRSCWVAVSRAWSSQGGGVRHLESTPGALLARGPPAVLQQDQGWRAESGGPPRGCCRHWSCCRTVLPIDLAHRPAP